VASHTFWHRRVPNVSPEEFRDDLLASKAAIEDACGAPVDGFRAPSFSIVPGTEWAFDVLLECGFRYDSSVFPIRRPGYGFPSAPLVPHSIARPQGQLLEIPLTVLQVAGTRVPAAGGGYLRHFPLGVLQRAFRQRDRAQAPGVFYVHPWELDPEQPRLAVSTLTRVRHYRGLDTTDARINSLLGEFKFQSIRAWLQDRPPTAPRSTWAPTIDQAYAPG
jgi:polysaccharide deacetylase family protein (PEP-CTERM system associated)